MFQSLRQNSIVYIIDKSGDISLKKGMVTSVTNPMPKYNVAPIYGQPQEMIVDITVKVDNKDVTYQKLPAQAEIADFGSNGIFITDNKEAANAEIHNIKQNSINILESEDFHRSRIEQCDKILSEMNPELAQKQQQDKEMNEMKEQLKLMTQNMTQLMETNKALMARLNIKETTV